MKYAADDDDTPVRAKTQKRVKLQGLTGKGGAGRGQGRPPGAQSRMTMAAREAAMSTGALPHELMLGWARGEPRSRKVPGPDSDKNDPSTWITEYLPVEPDEMDGCAKAAAPYFAPKMSTVELINGVSDDDLNQLLESAAKEAGFDLAAFGEGTQGTGEDDQAE